MMPGIVFIFISIQLLVVAYTDFKTRKISNMWMLINFIFFILLSIFFPKMYIWEWKVFILPTVFLFVGFGLFLLKIMGGGDSKYLSSLYLLIPYAFQETVLVYLLYTTILVGSSLLLFNAIKNFDDIIKMIRIYDIEGIKRKFGKKFTYAPVIFIAWMWFGWNNLKQIIF